MKKKFMVFVVVLVVLLTGCDTEETARKIVDAYYSGNMSAQYKETEHTQTEEASVLPVDFVSEEEEMALSVDVYPELPEDTMVYENFSGGILIEDYDTKFEILSMNMTDEYYCIAFKAYRNAGYKPYFDMDDFKINGCEVDPEYYRDGEYMRQILGDGEWRIDRTQLNALGITDVKSVSFYFEIGDEGYTAVSLEHKSNFLLFPGEKGPVRYVHMPKTGEQTLIDNENIYMSFIDRCTDPHSANKQLVHFYVEPKDGRKYSLRIYDLRKDDIKISLFPTYIGDVIWVDGPMMLEGYWSVKTTKWDYSDTDMSDFNFQAAVTSYDNDITYDVSVQVDLSIVE